MTAAGSPIREAEPPIPDALLRDPELPAQRACLAALILVAVWFWAHPYFGIRHDAILYLGQALRRLHPDTWSRDLFFAHGSQADFTLFDSPLAWLVDRWGAGPVEIALTAACNLAWIAAAWMLCGRLDGSRRWIGTLGVIVLPPAYARLQDFNVGEDFLTARSIAEPLVLLGVAAWAARRRVAGGAGLMSAALLHPLVALPGIVVAWCLEVAQDRRWLWGLAALPLVVITAALGAGPFAGLLHRFDPAWWDAVVHASGQVDMATWSRADLLAGVLDVVVAGVALGLLPPEGRRLVKATLAAAVLLLAIAWVGGVGLHDVLIVQLQLWRATWLLHVVVMASVGPIAARAWAQGETGRWLAAAILAAVLAIGWTVPQSWIFLAWLLLATGLHFGRVEVAARAARAAMGATWAAIVMISGVITVGTWRSLAGDPVLQGIVVPAQSLALVPTWSALLAIGLWLLVRRVPARVMAWPVVGVLIVGAALWDQRSSWHRTIESAAPESNPFGATIPPRAQVYWHLELFPTWVLLQRASWVSPAQGSGVVFDRDTALDFQRRMVPVVAMLQDQSACQGIADARGLAVECQPSQTRVEALCRMPAGPDFMVFDAPYDRGRVGQWNYQVGPHAPVRTAYLYDCAQMR